MRLWTVAIAVGMWAAVAINALLADGGRTALGGDFGADFRVFWTAGRLVADGDAVAIWDPRALAARSPELFDGDLSSYPYPPHVAMLYAPITMLTFRAAYFVHVLAMLAAATWAATALARVNEAVRRHRVATLAAILSIPPTLHGVAGGHASYLVLALTVAGFGALHRGRVGTGAIILSGLSFKPQFLATPLGHALRRDTARIWMWWSTIGIALYLVAVPGFGWDWPQVWLQEGVGTWDGYQTQANRGATISLLAAARTAPGPVRGAAVVAALGVGAWLVRMTIRRWPALDIAHRVGALSSLTLLLSPTALYYELVLVLPALAAYADRRGAVALPRLVAFWVLSWGVLANNHVVSVGLPLAVWAWALCVEPRRT